MVKNQKTESYCGTGSRIRTGTVSPPQTPEACASTNFAIPAHNIIDQKTKNLLKV